MEIKTPFDIINLLGTVRYNDVPTIDKTRHSFIINRMMSRTLPEYSVNFSHVSIKPYIVVDLWHNIFIKLDSNSHTKSMLNKIRSNMRISMAKKKEVTKKTISKEWYNRFLILTNLSSKEGEILKDLYMPELIKYIKKIEKMEKTVQ